jgi:membrane fusion protein (multidrug efflux system)
VGNTATLANEQDLIAPADDARTTVPPKSAEAASSSASARSKRKRIFTFFAAFLVLAMVGYASYWWFIGSRYVTTDNAYVDAIPAQITPLISAAVIDVPVKDTQRVHAGDVLVVLDNADARLAVTQAEAQLGQITRRVRGYFANDMALGAEISSRDAAIAGARSDVERARAEFEHRKALAENGAVSQEELTAAENRLREANAALLAAQAQRRAAEGTRQVNQALIAGVSADANPEVVAARAQFEQAKLNLARTVIRAPIDGVVARNTAQIGQRVQVGATLMSIVPIDEVFVNANFKEVQLPRVRVGQSVELESDLYGRSVTFHGRVAGIAGGTGSAFAIIPAQNATGNWIKVVQRLPVRIELDLAELRAHPLSVGLSMAATINTGR